MKTSKILSKRNALAGWIALFAARKIVKRRVKRARARLQPSR